MGNTINLTFSVSRGGHPGICDVSDRKAREGAGAAQVRLVLEVSGILCEFRAFRVPVLGERSGL